MKRGFTLIELLVVIAIIGILAVVVIMNVANATPKAQRAAALDSLNTVLRAANTCLGNGDSLTAVGTPPATYAAPAANANVCAGASPAANAVWPGAGTLNGYTYTALVTANTITGVTVTSTGSGAAITCTPSPGVLKCN